MQNKLPVICHSEHSEGSHFQIFTSLDCLKDEEIYATLFLKCDDSETPNVKPFRLN